MAAASCSDLPSTFSSNRAFPFFGNRPSPYARPCIIRSGVCGAGLLITAPWARPYQPHSVGTFPRNVRFPNEPWARLERPARSARPTLCEVPQFLHQRLQIVGEEEVDDVDMSDSVSGKRNGVAGNGVAVFFKPRRNVPAADVLRGGVFSTDTFLFCTWEPPVCTRFLTDYVCVVHP